MKPRPTRPRSRVMLTLEQLEREVAAAQKKAASKAAKKAERAAAPPAPKRGRCPTKQKGERCCLPAGHSGAHSYLTAPQPRG